MRRFRGALAWCLSALLVTILTFLAAESGGAAPKPTPVIVDLKPGTDTEKLVSALGIKPTHRYSEISTGFSADVTAKQLAAIEADRRVLAVTKDRVIARIPRIESKLGADRSNFRRAGFDLPPGANGGDQFISAEIRRVRADESATAAIDGAPDAMNVDIAILDGGVDATHPDLNLVGGYNCVGPRGATGWGVDENGDGHGTFIAGQIAARDNGFGVVGVAPDARIYSVVTFDENAAMSLSQYMCGLDWLNRMASRLEVVNMSFTFEDDGLGGCRPNRARSLDRYHFGICRIVNRGVTVVAAAGNESIDARHQGPAFYEESIAVSAMADYDGEPGGLSSRREECFDDGDIDDKFAFFSNFGEVVDVAAPGMCNISTGLEGRYAVGDGTSFATPLVAGGAALLMSQNPNMTPAQVRDRIIANAEPGPVPGDPDLFPEGVLNVSTF